MSQYTPRQYVLIWACSDSKRHTYADVSPALQTKQTPRYKIVQLSIINMQLCKNYKNVLLFMFLACEQGEKKTRLVYRVSKIMLYICML